MIISKIVASLFATQRSRTCNRNKMAIDKIQVSGDPRVQYKSANLNGRKYGMKRRISAFHRLNMAFCQGSEFMRNW